MAHNLYSMVDEYIPDLIAAGRVDGIARIANESDESLAEYMKLYFRYNPDNADPQSDIFKYYMKAWKDYQNPNTKDILFDFSTAVKRGFKYIIYTAVWYQEAQFEKHYKELDCEKYLIYRSPPTYNRVHPERNGPSMTLYLFDLISFAKDNKHV